MSDSRHKSVRLLGLSAASALVVVLAGCGGSPAAAPAATTTPPSTTTEAPPTTPPVTVPSPVFPLTGLPETDPAAAAHPAVVVKMDNSAESRPQAAINAADLVFELRVEGITRYAVVFHSETPDLVGPVRSARSSDIDLVGALGRPLFAWSGANPSVIGQVGAASDGGLLVDASRGANPPEYWRDNSRSAPHNLFASIPLLLGRFGGGATAPPPVVLAYARPGAPLPAAAVDEAGVTVDFGGGVQAEYVWDAERHGWDRFQVDALHGRDNSATVDAAGVQVAPANVVVLSVEYSPSAADTRSPQAHTVGGGVATVLTQGRAITGHWMRGSNTEPFLLLADDGTPIALTPGRTWVALPENGASVSAMDVPTAQGMLALRR